MVILCQTHSAANLIDLKSEVSVGVATSHEKEAFDNCQLGHDADLTAEIKEVKSDYIMPKMESFWTRLCCWKIDFD